MSQKTVRRIALAFSFLAASAMTTAARTPQTLPHTPQTSARTQSASKATDLIKITGCLKLEKDVPGLKPSVAERAGINDDYMLTSVLPAKDSTVSGIGLGPMYEIEGIEKSQLKDHLNQEVELEGKIGKPDSEGDAPDFNAASIKTLSATCVAK